MKSTGTVLTLVVLATAAAAPAGITGFAGGTAAPGATLGPYTITPFGADGRPLYTGVTSVDSPLGGSVDFSIPLEHYRVGDGWATWSHGYLGDVYYTNGASDVTMVLPDQTEAFYFYAEPNPYSEFTIVATAQDGTQVIQGVNGGAGAAYYGFYGTGGSYISSIAVTTPQPVAFAIGEFGIATVPAPAGILLAVIGTGIVGHLRRRKML